MEKELATALVVARLISDVPEPEEFTPEVICTFGQTVQNQESIFDGVADSYWCYLNEIGTKAEIWLDGETADCGYPGYEAWHEELVARLFDLLGTDQGPTFVPVMGCKTNAPGEEVTPRTFNTFTEAVAIIALAKERGVKNILIVAPPFHLPRCYISLVTAAIDAQCADEINIFGQPSGWMPWGEETIHSSGIQVGIRSQILVDEIKKIVGYANLKPELVPAYMDERDRRVGV